MFFLFNMKEIQQAGINGKPNKADEKEKGKLLSDSRIYILESPYPIKEIVINDCKNKAGSVGDEFINMKFFFTPIGYSKINGEANRACNSKAEDLYQQVGNDHFSINDLLKCGLSFFYFSG